MKGIRLLISASFFVFLQLQSPLLRADDLFGCSLQPTIVLVPTVNQSLVIQCPAGTVVANKGQIISKTASQLFFQDKPGMCKVVDGITNKTLAAFNAVYNCRSGESSGLLIEPPVVYNTPKCSSAVLSCSRILITKGLQIFDATDNVTGNTCLCPITVR